MLSIEIAARLSAVIVAIGVLQSSIQLLSGLRKFSSVGLLDWAGRGRLGNNGAAGLRVALSVRILCSVGLIIPFQTNLLYGMYAVIVLLSGFFLAYRIGYGKDGSNQISVIVVAGLAFTFLIPAASPFQAVGLYFIAAQAVFSYFAAGISKLFSAEWRRGTALQTVLNTATYGQATIARLVSQRPWLGSFTGWSVIAVEIVFPVALVVPFGAMIALLIAGALLHLGTVALIGLDTFFWAFTATFPAIIFVHGVLVGGW